METQGPSRVVPFDNRSYSNFTMPLLIYPRTHRQMQVAGEANPGKSVIVMYDRFGNVATDATERVEPGTPASLLLSVCQIGCTSLERHDGPLGEFSNRELYRTVQLSIREQRLRSNVKQFQGGCVFKAHRLLYHSTLGRE